MSHPRQPLRFFLVIFGLLGGALHAGLVYGLDVAWPLSWVLSASVATFLAFGWDKGAARRGGNRIPESALLWLSFVGGTPGALVAMPLFRHKTVKGSFRRNMGLVIAAQVLIVVAFLVLISREA